jgi:hypothetical protein
MDRNRKGGGISVFIREDIHFNVIDMSVRGEMFFSGRTNSCIKSFIIWSMLSTTESDKFL